MITLTFNDQEFGHKDFVEMCQNAGFNENGVYNANEVLKLLFSCIENFQNACSIDEVVDYKEDFSIDEMNFLAKLSDALK